MKGPGPDPCPSDPAPLDWRPGSGPYVPDPDRGPAGAPPASSGGTRAPSRSRTAAALRRALWWYVLHLTGGVERRGRLPRGGCVVVANHSSHADTAALLAALDARHTPAIGAAADYWFASPWRRRICRRLAAGFPVRRTGGGMGDLLAMTGELRSGRAVVLFPEGTRGADGAPGAFHRGALVLASAAGVPVVPVGIAGTDRLLPKNGRLRPSPVRVRIGAPLPSSVGPDRARAEVAALNGPADTDPPKGRRTTVAASRFGPPLTLLVALIAAARS